MAEVSKQDEAVKKLKDLNLREYEAKCFVALTEIEIGTARDVSEQIDVPRTRVYEAIRVLESKGLVEVQHTSPQRFRAISPDEAISLLQQRYQARIDSLEELLDELHHNSIKDDDTGNNEIWSLTEDDTITARTETLLTEADEEILMFLAEPDILSDSVLQTLRDVSTDDVELSIGGGENLSSKLPETIPEECVYSQSLPWLYEMEETYGTDLGRILIVDDGKALATAMQDDKAGEQELAVYGDGLSNSFVVIARRLLAAEMSR